MVLSSKVTAMTFMYINLFKVVLYAVLEVLLGRCVLISTIITAVIGKMWPLLEDQLHYCE